jgi:hypothetical protein
MGLMREDLRGAAQLILQPLPLLDLKHFATFRATQAIDIRECP